ncbi:SDR family oxidoreductase [Zhihengliuella salsuginis]|uniref:NAD(P)-dependent oxidoreductase n=1 Tax=Zhihengliuella salsuginis TaxID=578222 RepID=A0ABQ3GCK3_9MICC|nr:SDR family oxidoreductase [Zhihengliuella salsuginis]GHC99716.1 NAD(P)-dependent oxidoreductase [Zhihengliuella salsuginis]
MSVLIAGCGDLGTETGLRFARAGHRVIGWRRSPQKLPPRIEGVEADLTAELPAIPRDVDTVVITASASSREREAYRAGYVGGAEKIIGALERDEVAPRRVLYVSSTAVYGEANGGLVDETTDPAPRTWRGEIQLEAEELLARGLAATGTGFTALRLGGIYGPGRTMLIDRVASRRAVLPDEPRYTNRIHRDDAAQAIVHLTTRVPDPAPLYLGVDTEPAELGDVLRFLAQELGVPTPPTGDVPMASGGSKRCSNAALLGTGFTFAFPTYREGYRAVLSGEGARHP